MLADPATKELLERIGDRDSLVKWREANTQAEFYCTQYDILAAESELNRLFAFRGIATLNDFFDRIPLFDNRVFERVSDYPYSFNKGWCNTCFEEWEAMWVETVVDTIDNEDEIIFEISFDIPPCWHCGDCTYCEIAGLRDRGEDDLCQL